MTHSETLPVLIVFCIAACSLGTAWTVCASSQVFDDCATAITFGVIFARLWIQEILHYLVAKDSPRFRALPAALQKHDASLLTRLVVFAFLMPGTLIATTKVFIHGNEVASLPGIRLGAIQLGVLNVLDLTQRRKFDWRLHAHHFALCAATAVLAEVQNPTFHDAGLVVFSFLSVMDEPVWVLWSMSHLRRQRDNEIEQERVGNDAKELFPSPHLYSDKMLPKLYGWAFLHYTLLARGGTVALISSYMIKYYAVISIFWRCMLPILFFFFLFIDMDVIILMYHKATEVPRKAEEGVNCGSGLVDNETDRVQYDDSEESEEELGPSGCLSCIEETV